MLGAARTLLARDGYEQLTIEGIAAEAGVSKQTIYRWWPSKAEVLGEALLDGDLPGQPSALPVTDDLAADLRGWLTLARDALGGSDNAALARALIAVTANDPALGAPLNVRFAGPILASLTDRLDAAKATGAVRADADSAAVAGVLLSTSSYAALTGQTLADERIAGIVDVIVRGISAEH